MTIQAAEEYLIKFLPLQADKRLLKTEVYNWLFYSCDNIF